MFCCPDEGALPEGRGLEFGHFGELRRPARPRELNFLGVKRGSRGPKGQESLAQGLPWVFGLSREALKGRPLATLPRTPREMPAAPSGLLTLGRIFPG